LEDEKKTSRSTSPKKVLKGTRQFEHSLFKLKPARMLKNVSWKHKLPDVISIEHCHIYHSINERFQPNTFCAPAGGHFHEVTVDWSKKAKDSDGPLVTCGPAVRKKLTYIDGLAGPVTSIDPVCFERHKEVGGDITDNHTHEVEYIDTEVLSAATREQKREQERRLISDLMTPTDSRQSAALQKTATSAEGAQGLVKE
jgi:hypothetical protein